MSNLLDEIEKELKAISSWPWSADAIWVKDASGYALPATMSNNPFIAKSPERIAMLVKLARDAIKLAKLYEAESKQNVSLDGLSNQWSREFLDKYKPLIEGE